MSGPGHPGVTARPRLLPLVGASMLGLACGGSRAEICGHDLPGYGSVAQVAATGGRVYISGSQPLGL